MQTETANAVRQLPPTRPSAADLSHADPVDLYVGRAIRNRRRALGMSQETLAAALDLTFQQVQKYERAANRVSCAKLYGIAQALACQPADFFPPADAPSVDLGNSAASLMAETDTGFALQKLWPILCRDVQKSLLTLAGFSIPAMAAVQSGEA